MPPPWGPLVVVGTLRQDVIPTLRQLKSDRLSLVSRPCETQKLLKALEWSLSSRWRTLGDALLRGNTLQTLSSVTSKLKPVVGQSDHHTSHVQSLGLRLRLWLKFSPFSLKLEQKPVGLAYVASSLKDLLSSPVKPVLQVVASTTPYETTTRLDVLDIRQTLCLASTKNGRSVTQHSPSFT